MVSKGSPSKGTLLVMVLVDELIGVGGVKVVEGSIEEVHVEEGIVGLLPGVGGGEADGISGPERDGGIEDGTTGIIEPFDELFAGFVGGGGVGNGISEPFEGGTDKASDEFRLFGDGFFIGHEAVGDEVDVIGDVEGGDCFAHGGELNGFIVGVADNGIDAAS